MTITELQIYHFRNLQQVNLEPAACNLLVGDNGSGKTSLLESLYLLSRGKSFRHHQPKHYISHGCSTTTVFARLLAADDAPLTVAIEKAQDATTQLRLDGKSLASQSPLTQLLPTLLLEPNNLNSLEQGSQPRRELFDWLAFHVEQNFFPEWLAYQRLLRQRNSLLKQLTHTPSHWQQQELTVWDGELGRHAATIHQIRQALLQRWQPYFAEQLAQFLPNYHARLRLRYSVGFDNHYPLEQLLAQRLTTDIEAGYTRLGSHRADLNVMLDNEVTDEQDGRHKQTVAATDGLSRGEKKLLMAALRLSQLPLLTEAGKVPLVLLDDITAELDEKALQLLLMGLKRVNAQLFITSLTDAIVPKLQAIWQQELKLFHVEQGKITPQT